MLERWGWWAIAVAIAAGLAVLVWWFAPWKSETTTFPEPTPDPRLSYNGPYLNIHPDVAFVGDAVCAGCHHEHAESFRHHPMGRSITPIALSDQKPLEKLPSNPFTAFGSEFRVERDGEKVFQREVRRDANGREIYINSFEIHYVAGSGTHAYSYLTDRNGYLFQAPMTWYSTKKAWDISPGWGGVGGGRAILPGCLVCHANRVEPVADTRNRYEPPTFRGHSIGCERCHGPGAKHVEVWRGQAPASKGRDYSIVNPKHLEPKLREAICQQCHLEGEHRHVRHGRNWFDFRPGMPLEEFQSVFVRAEGENATFVNHVEQMNRSKCFTAAAGQSNQMGCISCHDPHVKPTETERVNHFRSRCLTCHAEKGCMVPEPKRRETSKHDSCIDCHMPKKPASDVVHAAVTDHRIPRQYKAERRQVLKGPEQVSGVRMFHKPKSDPRTPGDERDWGIALAELTHFGKLAPSHAKDAVTALDMALAANSLDAEAHEARARALAVLGKPLEATAAYKAALEIAPKRESSLREAARLNQTARLFAESEQLWKRAIEVDPWQQEYHGNLALVLRSQGDWYGARDHAAACLQLAPDSHAVRKLYVLALIETGDLRRARVEFAKLEALNPPEFEAFRLQVGPKLR